MGGPRVPRTPNPGLLGLLDEYMVSVHFRLENSRRKYGGLRRRWVDRRKLSYFGHRFSVSVHTGVKSCQVLRLKEPPVSE